MARYGTGALIALAACVVLAGPVIRDNFMRALWIGLGMGAVLLCYLLIVRRRAGRK
jgi:hypothetical protein